MLRTRNDLAKHLAVRFTRLEVEARLFAAQLPGNESYRACVLADAAESFVDAVEKARRPSRAKKH
jgi:hypothetical protein